MLSFCTLPPLLGSATLTRTHLTSACPLLSQASAPSPPYPKHHMHLVQRRQVEQAHRGAGRQLRLVADEVALGQVCGEKGGPRLVQAAHKRLAHKRPARQGGGAAGAGQQSLAPPSNMPLSR